MALILFFVFSLLLHGALGELICEELPIESCSFAVASSGKRCLLETNVPNASGKGMEEYYQCKTSEVMVADGLHEWIETDACVDACGVSRMSAGISSDSLLEPYFTAKLCSQSCYLNCPNIVDLYFNMALGEGVYLPDLCEAHQNNPRRAMTGLFSSGAAAAGPASFAAFAPIAVELSPFNAPAPAPAEAQVRAAGAGPASFAAFAPIAFELSPFNAPGPAPAEAQVFH